MVFEESRSIRSFVGRIDPGDDVIEALTLLCDANDVGAAEVRVSGVIGEAEVVRFDEATKEYATVVAADGPFHVVHFVGKMAMLGEQPVLRADALLAVDGPAGQQLVFGQLRRATALDCEFVVQSYEDLEVRRKLDHATGRFPIEAIESTGAPAPPLSSSPPPNRERRAPETVSEPAGTTSKPEPAPQPEPEPTPAGEESSGMSWEDAIDASEEIKPASKREKAPKTQGAEPKDAEEVYGDYDFDEPILEPGDILNHPKLGECRVIKVEDDVYAHIRLSRGQIRKLALEVVELEFLGETDGKKRWKVRVGK